MASIEREVENALLNVVSGVTGVNFFTSERGTARTMPSVTVQAQIGSEELGPFSTTNSNITFYVAKVTGDSPAVISQNRTWSRAMTLDITATAKK